MLRPGRILAAETPLTPLVPAIVPAYRADIDGLRGVAVLSVLLFHVGAPAFGGGYVGVDVFFVISGYLIGGIVLTELGSHTFSLGRFYERRIRRIFPALFFMLGSSVLVAVMLLIPRDLETFDHSAVAVTTFVSNIWFWRQTGGYFQTPAEQQVLLHTWSLAVEEQFYIVFPLLLIAVQRAGRSRFALCISLLAAASLAVSVDRIGSSPDAVFFLAPPRAWEFLMGAIVASGVLPVLRRSGLRNILAAVGLGAIVVAVVVYDVRTVFPGLAALPPTLGAALIIHSGAAGKTIVGRLLASKPLVWTGVISYSLYLVHWPLIAFARQLAIVELTPPQKALLVLASFVLASVSWRFVEQPFRNRSVVPGRRSLFLAAAMTVLVFVAAGVFAARTKGLPARFDAAILANDPSLDSERERWSRCGDRRRLDGPRCALGQSSGQRQFLLWGDSHAAALAPAVDLAAARRDAAGGLASLNLCPPLLGIDHDIGPRDCPRFLDSVLDWLDHRPELHTVILSARWPYYAAGTAYQHEAYPPINLTDLWHGDSHRPSNAKLFERGLARMIERLRAMRRDVILAGAVPEVGYDSPAAYAIAVRTGRDLNNLIAPTRVEYETRISDVRRSFDALRLAYGIRVVDVATNLCNTLVCRVVESHRTLYRDGDHLSTYGSRSLAPLFYDIFDDH